MNLIRSSIVVSIWTLLSRIFGLARELVIAGLFGANWIADSINVSFKLPNLFRRIFAEGAFSVAFVPIFNEKLHQSDDGARKFAKNIFGLLLVLLISVICLMEGAMRQLMWLLAPGFPLEPEKFELTILLCRITMPYLLFISIAAFFGSILNSFKRFAAFAFAPIILSLCIIITPVILPNSDPVLKISYLIIIAGFLQVIFMLYSAKKIGFLVTPTFSFADLSVRKFFRNLTPAVLSSGAQQLDLFVSQSIASFIEGAISILSYADRIYQFPLSIIGITFSTILLPELSKHYQSGNADYAKKIQSNAIKLGLFLSIPAMLGIIILSYDIVEIICQRGAFVQEDTLKTSDTIIAFVLGLPAFTLAKIFMPILYANQNTRITFIITLKTMLTNTIFNIFFMQFSAHIGIALGSSLAAYYSLYLLIKESKSYINNLISKDFVIFTIKLLVSCCIMSIIVYFTKAILGQYIGNETFVQKLIILFCNVFSGLFSFFLSAFFLKLHKISYES